MKHLDRYLFEVIHKIQSLEKNNDRAYAELLEEIQTVMIANAEWTKYFFLTCLSNCKNGKEDSTQKEIINILLGIFPELVYAFNDKEFFNTIKQLGDIYHALPSMELFINMSEKALERSQNNHQETD